MYRTVHRRAQGPAPNLQRLLVELLGLGILALLSQGPGQVVVVRGRVGVVLAQRPAVDLQRFPVERLGLSELALIRIEDRQIVEGRGDLGMIKAEALLLDVQGLLIQRFRIVISRTLPNVDGDCNKQPPYPCYGGQTMPCMDGDMFGGDGAFGGDF